MTHGNDILGYINEHKLSYKEINQAIIDYTGINISEISLPSWYQNFNSTEATDCLKRNLGPHISTASSWVANKISAFDSDLQKVIGQNDPIFTSADDGL